MKAKQLVEVLLEAEEEVAEVDPRERAYARLQKLYARRGELQSEQHWISKFRITLHRKHVDPENVKSLDIHDGKCFGVWLRQGDYGAKIQRKSDAKDAQNKRFDAKVAPGERPTGEQHWARISTPKDAAPSEVSAYYVPFSPPLWVPEAVRLNYGRA